MSLINRGRGRRTVDHRRGAGQTLVEFALVFPIFLLLLFAIIEFAFVFSGMLGISFATRDAALVAAEAGSGLAGYDNGADCAILQAVDKAVGPPADDNRIEEVVIYKADKNGVEISGVSNRWTRGGSTTCPDGSVILYTRVRRTAIPRVLTPTPSPIAATTSVGADPGARSTRSACGSPTSTSG